MSSEVTDEQVKQSFSTALDRHGYGLQYSVLKQAYELSQKGSAWYREVSEFPVIQGSGTRIDFILRNRISKWCYLLAECKRVNPAYSNWCFARAPFTHRTRKPEAEQLIIEYAEVVQQGHLASYAQKWSYIDNAYHVAIEVKSNKKGDPCGETGQAIEGAATQICRGLNGMVDFFSKNIMYVGDDARIALLPVIFTTAQLWSSDVDLSTADLETGNVDLSRSKFIKQPWLIYQYHQSPGLKHTSSMKLLLGSLGEFMDTEYVRTIVIVNSPEGIEPFLLWSSNIASL